MRATSDAGSISRILYGVTAVTVIPLGRPLLDGSSDLPGSLAHRAGTHKAFFQGLRNGFRLLRPRIRLEQYGSRRCSPEYHLIPSLFGLAPCGVCHAPRITERAVRSYRTFSPLPWGVNLRAPQRLAPALPSRLARASQLSPFAHPLQGGIFSVALSVLRT